MTYHCRRKWLPPPLRKLSQGKVDKTTASSSSAATAAASSSSTATPSDRPFLKKGSEKAFKLASSVTVEEQPFAQKVTNIGGRFRDKSATATDQQQPHQLKSETDQSHAPAGQPAELENEDEVVLPPPMKPIQDSQAIINNGPTVVASSVVEQSPCKRVSYLNSSYPNCIENGIDGRMGGRVMGSSSACTSSRVCHQLGPPFLVR